MAASRPVPSPVVPNNTLMKRIPKTEEEASAMIGVPYREAIGALLYLSTRTRPDIAVAVGTLAKNVQEPLPLHWEGVNEFTATYKGQRTMFLSSKQESPQTR
jgi:hypothetical protein